MFSQLILGEVIKGPINEPIAMNSTLGWLISGNVPNSKESFSAPSVSLHASHEDNLDALLQKFWKQEEVPSKPHLNPEEEQCEIHFMQTHTRDASGRYEVPLPFKDRDALRSLNLGESVGRAAAMLRSMERKFQNDHKLKDAYH